MSKKFASQADLTEKKVTFEKLSENAYAYTAEGDPNTGVIIGDDGVMVIDTQAPPVMAQDVIRRIREVTDKPIRYVLLSHYHAVRVLGASAYGVEQIIASHDTYDLIVERGEADMKSEIGRFPRLFQAVESVPGLTWPTLAFKNEMTLWMGKLEVKILQVGRGHSKGDTIVWLPSQKVLFAGDLVEYGATPYCGDAYYTHWAKTLDNPHGPRRREAGARPGCRPAERGTGARGHRGHPGFCHRPLRVGPARCRRGQGPAGGLQGNLRRTEAEIRPLGDLRPLHAVRRDPRL